MWSTGSLSAAHGASRPANSVRVKFGAARISVSVAARGWSGNKAR
jgi:hypothetical protein